MAFPRAEYEILLYHITTTYPQVISSTLHRYSTSALTATVQGELVEEQLTRIYTKIAVHNRASAIHWYWPHKHTGNIPDFRH